MQSPEGAHTSQTAVAELAILPKNDAMNVRESTTADGLHPAFASPEGDVTLAARGGQTFFRVHSYTLKTTSGFFRTMYGLPQ